MDLLTVARAWTAAGFSVVPVAADGTKRPGVPWKQYQAVAADNDQIAQWFGSGQYDGLGIVCGAVSGNLELLEVEGRAVLDGTLQRYVESLKDHGLEALWDRLNGGYLEQSPSGGLHWLYRVDGPVGGNLKLARRPATPEELVANSTDSVKVLLETRGEGGYVVVAPSGGRTHALGKEWAQLVGAPDTVPVLTVEECGALHAIATLMDQPPALPSVRVTTPTGAAGNEQRPGDAYNAEADWVDILEGWTPARQYGTTVLWTRPGKNPRDGISASTGRNDADRLYVFSTSTEFQTERPYDKFGAYAVLHHGGDLSEAASALRAQGYGAPPEAVRRSTGADVAPMTDAPLPIAPKSVPEPVAAISLDQAHKVFVRWLGEFYDLDALDVVLAAAAAERLTGDPLWLMVISGSGNAKTETVQSLSGIGALAVSTISSEGALLSATSRKERRTDATGGLLRQLGSDGVLVIKDVTSILSMDRTVRGSLLAALREIYDGGWIRTVGTDGGQRLEWQGRIAVVGACTTAWDKAYEVIATMGDRFMLIRMDSTVHRVASGAHAVGNIGREVEMRTELADAVAGVLAGIDLDPLQVADDERDVLLRAADLVTLARTGVEFDYKGDVVDAHAPEMPTRFAKQLFQVARGAVALGIERAAALRLALRCARDSMPPLRLMILDDVRDNPLSTATEVRKRIGKPRSTVDRQLQALHMLGVLECREESIGSAGGIRWMYSVAPGIDASSLALPEL